MPRNNTNPYDPPKEYIKARLPKYEEPVIDWASLIIIIGSLSAIATITLLAISLFGKT
tara:strand:+ start:473 stop:646 length:174 start_codon:yes stop_codon:yes gene_type:complete